MAVILAIDDSLTDLTMIKHFLPAHTLLTAMDGRQGLDVLHGHPEIELILLDLHMPNMDGFTFLNRCKQSSNAVPIIILTNSDEIEKEILGLESGAVDYIRKPLNFRSLQKRIEVQLRLEQAMVEIKRHSHELEELVEQRTAEIRRTNEITINALVRLLETRNVESSDHSRRTKVMMEMLCRQLQSEPDVGYHLTEREIQELVDTAPLHDIGKVGIPDNILLKPDRLDSQEVTVMREHVNKGVEALDYSIEGDDAKISFIETAREMIASHHEWYDGSGYPVGLKGRSIPLSGRLMSVIDVYDALTSKRVYKDALSHAEALSIMRQESVRHFDPVIFRVFLSIAEEIRARLHKA